MAYLYNRGQSPNHQPILPPSPYVSPYRGSVSLPGGSPHSPNTHLPQTFEYSPWQRSTALPYEYAADAPPPWAPPPTSPTYGGQYSYAPPSPSGHHHHHHTRPRSRSHSHSQGQYEYSPSSYYTNPNPSFPNPTATNYAPNSQPYHVHPLLDGKHQTSSITFNLSSPTYSPTISVGPGNWSRIPDHELRHPATWPPVHRLRIICDFLPQWPIDIELDPSYFGGGFPQAGANIPPIQVGDVLWKIWESMRTAITQLDWASLPPGNQDAVSKAFAKRYRPYGNIEREKGVMRIDYTLGKVWFKGLTRVGDGVDVLKMHVA
ncbi:hypothetical protein AGABI1DRAFT_132335 [Agaricus bisporus var. burnettii JB137-S8]|uniref:DUF6699 domain-containing protein n=1 Tax=Agaricus bisporus var. burnettii (strain JB137-S8 / ATCC MYA-4627 / FGSC 10392) TaxID=597362 RepID=K5VLM8_AGABU|nr:uncharacterized protein AGABI1DRAFT_132335 [Agaricus bisporus var. burnettii JB137-S8]EKM75314.1 hypothetical protein AGABI1DRAFT_132335 [Agaricus bisporus var. burnettii JB137-S8]